MLATAPRFLDLGIVTALTAVLAFAAPRPTVLQVESPASAPAMPAPSAEPVAVAERANACDDEAITTIVFKGRVNALDPNTTATFVFGFADLPARYTVMTGARGEFEVRIPRAEIGEVDLCALPASNLRSSALFKDPQLSVELKLTFER